MLKMSLTFRVSLPEEKFRCNKSIIIGIRIDFKLQKDMVSQNFVNSNAKLQLNYTK